MVWPDIDVIISPGRTAFPSGIFSTRPTIPTTFALALRAARPAIAPTTAAEPPISPFISHIFAPGLSEMPPVSNVTPLPIIHAGFSPFLPPFHVMMTICDSRTEPWPTQSREFMPSAFMRFSPNI